MGSQSWDTGSRGLVGLAERRAGEVGGAGPLSKVPLSFQNPQHGVPEQALLLAGGASISGGEQGEERQET